MKPATECGCALIAYVLREPAIFVIDNVFDVIISKSIFIYPHNLHFVEYTGRVRCARDIILFTSLCSFFSLECVVGKERGKNYDFD